MLRRRLAYIVEHELLADEECRSSLTAMKRFAQEDIASIEAEMESLRAELRRDGIEA